MLSFETSGNYINFVYIEDSYPYTRNVLKRLHKTSRCIDWTYNDDSSKIDFTIDETSYDAIPISSIKFDGVVMSQQSDFETGIIAMFPGYASISLVPATGLVMQTSGGARTATITLTEDGGGNLQLTITEN